MDEGGHYYTVYYTSLAVGFSNKVAYRHAVLSQMADEVKYMDATYVQSRYCLNLNGTNFEGMRQKIPNQHRADVQQGSHALISLDSNENTAASAYQRSQTAIALSGHGANSLEFGLLLHRLGDTYAHSKIGNESTMYTVTTGESCFWGDPFNTLKRFGHLFHVHEPDYPFVRQNLFIQYLEDLYNVLYNKFLQSDISLKTRNRSTRPLHEVINNFKDIFRQLEQKSYQHAKAISDTMPSMAMRGAVRRPQIIIPDTQKTKWFMDMIRKSADDKLGVVFEPYRPENQEGMSLPEFLAQHTELGDLGITGQKLRAAAVNAIPPEAPYTAPKTLYDKAVDKFGKVVTEIERAYGIPR
jgi:hypothetical protein